MVSLMAESSDVRLGFEYAFQILDDINPFKANVLFLYPLIA